MPIHYAAAQGDLNLIGILVKAGAILNAKGQVSCWIGLLLLLLVGEWCVTMDDCPIAVEQQSEAPLLLPRHRLLLLQHIYLRVENISSNPIPIVFMFDVLVIV